MTGVGELRAIALIDGRTKKTTIFLQNYSERREQRMYGPALHPGDDAARALGVDAVLPREAFAEALASMARESRTLYTTFRPEVSIRVHAAPRDVVKDAVVKMDGVMTSFRFTDSRIKDAAAGFVQRYRTSSANSLGHSVGMEVHDVA